MPPRNTSEGRPPTDPPPAYHQTLERTEEASPMVSSVDEGKQEVTGADQGGGEERREQDGVALEDDTEDGSESEQDQDDAVTAPEDRPVADSMNFENKGPEWDNAALFTHLSDDQILAGEVHPDDIKGTLMLRIAPKFLAKDIIDALTSLYRQLARSKGERCKRHLKLGRIEARWKDAVRAHHPGQYNEWSKRIQDGRRAIRESRAQEAKKKAAQEKTSRVGNENQATEADTAPDTSAATEAIVEYDGARGEAIRGKSLELESGVETPAPREPRAVSHVSTPPNLVNANAQGTISQVSREAATQALHGTNHYQQSNEALHAFGHYPPPAFNQLFNPLVPLPQVQYLQQYIPVDATYQHVSQAATIAALQQENGELRGRIQNLEAALLPKDAIIAHQQARIAELMAMLYGQAAGPLN